MAKRKKHHRSLKTGLPPGTLVYVGNREEEKPELSVIQFNGEDLHEFTITHWDDLPELDADKHILWINVNGLHDVEAIQKIGNHFGIHSLILEDIVNTEQRPKVEIYTDHIFLTLKMVMNFPENSSSLDVEQVSFLMGPSWLISFQEEPGDVFDQVRERLQRPISRIRQHKEDYLLYSLTDLVVDRYLQLLEDMGDDLEQIEDQILSGHEKVALHRLQMRKRQLHQLRRAVVPLREAIGELYREENALISPFTQRYLSDLHDHLIQVHDLMESLRELCVELRETHLSMLSNRANEVMKVLTIIATIFIPLTFIVGIYGMNFRFMPEIEWRYGYLMVWIIMLTSTYFMLRYFRKKKWF